MPKLLEALLRILLIVSLPSCNDTTFSPVPEGDVDTLLPNNTTVLSQQGDSDILSGVDNTSQYPDGYCERTLWVLDCAEDIALIAKGSGCIKFIYILLGDEAEEFCPEMGKIIDDN